MINVNQLILVRSNVSRDNITKRIRRNCVKFKHKDNIMD